MPSSPAERIALDLDDTLYLERDFAFSGYRAAEDWLAGRGRAPGFARTCRDLFLAGERRNIFDQAAQAAGLPPELVPELVRIYRDHRPRISLCPDAARYLARNTGLAIISDGPERTQRNKIAALGLDAYCDVIVPTGQWPEGFCKPHPRAYELVAAASAGRRCVYVADNAAKDFLTPNRLGWITIQILRPERVHVGAASTPAHAAMAVIHSLDQLDSTIAALRG